MNPRNNEYKERNQQFIEEYRRQKGVKELYNGVLYRVIANGGGVKPSARSIITVHYKGKLINGKLFDSTSPGCPASFKLSSLIDGWRSALKEMPVGARWEIVIPFNLGYGSRQSGAIKPFSTLIFEVNLLRIE